MRTICILNLKGGVAKTATTVNMAAILSHDYGKRVLVVDADSQCNTSEFFGAVGVSDTLADLLRSKPDDGLSAQACIAKSNYYWIDLIAADDGLMDLDLTKVESNELYINCLCDLRKRLETVKVSEDAAPIDVYDYMIIDCPPAFNAASAAALLAADEVIIPIKLDAFSLRGMKNLMQQIANMRKINSNLKLSGILPTMWYRSDKIIEAEELLRNSAFNVFPHIRRTNKVDDMTFIQEPIISTSPHSAAAVDYRKFVKAFLCVKSSELGGVANG